MPRPLDSSGRFFVTPFIRRFDDIHSWTIHFGEESNLMSLPGREAQFFERPPISIDSYDFFQGLLTYVRDYKYFSVVYEIDY
jgi:hypothetical protein